MKKTTLRRKLQAATGFLKIAGVLLAAPFWLLAWSIRAAAARRRFLRELRAAGVRVTLDDRSEKIGYKIREGRYERIPYMVVAGDSETEKGTLAVRKRGLGDLGEMDGAQFLNTLLKEIADKTIF